MTNSNENGRKLNPLELARQEIDSMDNAILGLLARRRKFVEEVIMPTKQKLALPVTDNGREASHREDLVKKGGLLGVPEATVHAVFDPIVKDAREIQITGTSTYPEVDQAEKV